jgi:GTPase
MFVDNVEIEIRAGKGGSGSASFKHEKFLPFGGPDGGDGGKGGDIYFLADSDLEDLGSFKHKLLFKAGNGGRGGGQKMHGLNAEDLVIKIPAGTAVYLKDDGKEQLLADLQKDGQRVLAAKGGKGGKGNVHFATATRKAPKIFQPGEEGVSYKVILRMRLFVDVCILGLPNSGKSSLLAAVSAARPEVADYPFTTRRPMLGSVDDGHDKYIWAEIPALLEGSYKGKGLGNWFLAHVERAKTLVYLLDGGNGDPEDEYRKIKNEINLFDPKLLDKKYVVAVNKIDLVEDQSQVKLFKDTLSVLNIKVCLISSTEKVGLTELITEVHKLVKEGASIAAQEIQPQTIFRPKPIDG